MAVNETVTIEQDAMRMLDDAGIDYSRVYVYAGCTLEHCGPMPRVVVVRDGHVPTCYSLPELAWDCAHGGLCEAKE